MEQRIRNDRPRARAGGLVVRELPEEVLVYDLERHRAICLNHTAALVWKHCDGETSVAEISRRLGAHLRLPVAEDVVWLALDQLARDHLLEGKIARPAAFSGISRRELMRRLGVAAAVALPLVTSVVAPTAAEAASCLPTGAACTAPAECCSGLCPGSPNGTCV
ncbi:MAG TPA: PqqD family protein [Pyrinomonadaceae bacterium]